MPNNFQPFSVDCVIASVFKAIIEFAKEHGWEVFTCYPYNARFAEFDGKGAVAQSESKAFYTELPLPAAIERIKAGPPKLDAKGFADPEAQLRILQHQAQTDAYEIARLQARLAEADDLLKRTPWEIYQTRQHYPQEQ